MSWLSRAYTAYENTVYDGMAAVSGWWTGEEVTREDMRAFDDRITSQADAAIASGLDATGDALATGTAGVANVFLSDDSEISADDVKNGVSFAVDSGKDTIAGTVGFGLGWSMDRIEGVSESLGWNWYDGSLQKGVTEAVRYTLDNPGRGAVLGVQGLEKFGSNVIATPGYLLDLGNMTVGWATGHSYEGSAGGWIQGKVMDGIDYVDGAPVVRNETEQDIIDGVAVGGDIILATTTLGSYAAARGGAVAGKLAATGTRLAEDGAVIAARGPTRAAAAAAGEGAEAAKPGMLGRAFNFMSPNGARAVYISEASASERLSLLATRGDEGLPYMKQIIRDIRAGDAKIESSAIDGLRANGRIPEEIMTKLDEVQGMLRADGGIKGAFSFKYSPSNLPGTLHSTLPTVPTASLRGLGSTAGTLAFAPAKLAYGAIRHPFSLRGGFAAATAVGADQYLFDGAIRNAYGDMYGWTARRASDAAAFTTGSENFVAQGLDVAAAGVDKDQTIAGTFNDQGHTYLSMGVSMVPGMGGGEHTPADAPAPAVAVAGAGAGAATPVAAAADTSGAKADTENYMQNIMKMVADSPIGDFLESIGPWGQMIAFGVAAMFLGRGMLLLSGQGGNQLLATAAVIGSVIAAPTLANAFHDATNSTAPKPSDVAGSALGNINTDRLAHDGKEFIGMITGGPAPA